MTYDLRPCRREDVLDLFDRYHGYKSVGRSFTYGFAVYENSIPVAAYVWQPPPPGAAKAVCPEAPHAVLALSRMVAVPREERSLRHISKPLRKIMRSMIDRTRWPVLLTYHDEGQGHTGHVYKCSGWHRTGRTRRPYKETSEGRTSVYRNGAYVGGVTGYTWVVRWEHWICGRGTADLWLSGHGWRRIPLIGKTWKSGNPAYTWTKE